MNLVQSGPTPKKYTVGRIDNDWSARHVRLRFEMVIAAISFFLVSRYGAATIDLPIIKLPENFDDDILKFAILAFALFSWVSFIVRTAYEKSQWPHQELVKHSEITAFSKKAKDALKDQSGLALNNKELDAALIELISRKDEIRATANAVASLKRDIDEFHDESGVNSPVHPKFWSRVRTRMQRAGQYSSAMAARAQDLEIKHGRVTGGSFRLEAVPDNYQDNLSKLNVELKQLRADLRERTRELHFQSVIRRVQTDLLSVWCPTVLAIVLVSVGLDGPIEGVS